MGSLDCVILPSSMVYRFYLAFNDDNYYDIVFLLKVCDALTVGLLLRLSVAQLVPEVFLNRG